ncbi:MAG: beta strand repeat-containing protein, partial [Prosthecobacter sp.]|uniref:beta strand repeat-containing protein n=1 Tax=Prosthecobacter sp. TaxID=1965333 RepID=UPI00390274B2
MLVAFLGIWQAGQSLHAATLTWDITAGDGAAITGGTGTWADGLGNWNTGAGDTTWNNATPDAAIFGGTAGTVTLGGAVTVGNMNFSSAYTLAGGGNILTLASSTITANAAATISAPLGGTSGLIKAGTGMLTLSGLNIYTGVTAINAGMLNATSITNGGTSSNIGAASNAAANLVLNGGTLQYSGATASTDRLFSVGTAGGTISLPVAATLSFTNTGSMGFNGEAGARTLSFAFSNSVFGGIIELGSVIADNGGATSIVKSNTLGTVRLTNNGNTYSGTTTINGGTLSIGTLGGSTGSIGSGNIIINAGTLLVARTGTVALSQIISGAGGVTSNVATALTLSGNNTYTGVTRLLGNGGVLSISSIANGGIASNIGAASSAAGNLSITNLATLRYTGAGASTDRLFEIPNGTANPVATIEASGSGALLFTNTGSMGFGGGSGVRTLVLSGTNIQNNTMSPAIGDNGGATTLTKSGAGTWLLNGTNTYSGTTTINAGILQVGSGGTTGTLGTAGVTNNASLMINRSNAITISNNISGTGSFTQAGTGTTTLSGTNAYTGATVINAGVLNVTSIGNGGTSGGIGAASNAATNLVLNGGTLRYSGTGSGNNSDRLFSVGTGGGTLDFSGTGFSTSFTNTGSMGFNGQSGARTLTLAGNNTLDNTVALVIGDNGGATSVIRTGSGVSVLSGTNTYTGVTTVSGTAILRVTSLTNGGVASGMGASSNAATNLVLDGGVFKYSGGTASTDRLFSVTTNGGTLDSSGGSPVSFTNTGSMGFNGQSGARTLTLTGVNGAGATLAVTLGDNGGATSLAKTGAGTWSVTGTNTYTGATTISAGTLIVSTLGNGGSNSNIGASTNAAANLVLNGGTLQYTGAASSTDRLFSVGTSGGTLDASGTGAVNFTNTGSMGFNSQTGTRTLTLTGSFLGLNIVAAVIADNSGATSLTKTGSGKWVLTGANTYSGTTTVSTGVLQIGNSSAGGTFGTGNIVNNATLVLFRSDTFTLSQTISGTGTLSNAAGTAVLTGLNTYTGFTGISAGTVSVDTLANGGSASNIGASTSVATNLQITGGTLKYTGAGVSTDRLFAIGVSATIDASGTGALSFTNTGSMGFMTTAAHTLTLAGTYTGNNSLAAVIGDNVGTTAVIKSGAGTWMLTGTNTYTGTTTISSGILQIGNGGTVGNLGTGAVTNNGTLIINRSNAITISNVMSGTGALIQNGTGTTTLSGLSNAWGSATVNAGILAAGVASGLGSNSAMTVNSGGTLATNGMPLGAAVGSLSGSGIVQNGSSTNSGLTVSGNISTTFSGVIQNGGTGSMFLTKMGAVTTLTLSGSNTYTAATTITGGTLSVSSLADGGSASNIGASTNAAANLILNNATAVLKYTGATVSTDRLFSIGSSGGTLDASGTGALSFTNTGGMGFNSQTGTRTLTLTGTNTGSNILAAIIGDNSGATSLTKSGAGTWVLAGANTYTGTTTISAGVLQIGTGGTVGTLGTASVTNNANLTINRSDAVVIANAISGTGSFTQAGAGTTTLTGTNTYTGTTTINAGTLQVGNGGTTGILGTGTVTNNASLVFNRSDLVTVSSSISGTGSLTQAGTGTIQLMANNSYSGTTTISAGTLQIGIGGTTGTLGTGAVTNNASLMINRSDAITVANTISGTGTVTKAGAGTTTLSATNSYTGATVINSGTLSVSSLANGGTGSGIGSATSSSANLVLNGGTLQYTGAAASTDRLFS